MSSQPQEVHGYYFASGSGALKGVVPYGSVITSIPGPFVSFNPETRILSTARHRYLLPQTKMETSPFLLTRTIDQLNKLHH
jgi:hypothetical protein